MIEIKCTKAVYERLIEATYTYFDTSTQRCFLGKTYLSCPAERHKELTCKECLRKHIKRVGTTE